MDKWVEGANVHPTVVDKGLMRFPNELLLAVLQHCPTILDKICFALTCRRLLVISRGHVEKLKTEIAAPWAGERIICISDAVLWSGLPHDLLTEAERRKFQEAQAADDYYGDDDGLYVHFVGNMTPLFSDLCFDATYRITQRMHSDSDSEFLRFKALYSRYYPVREDWVACNLTEALYIRASAIGALTKQPTKTTPFIDGTCIDLGHAILTQLCWTDYPSVVMPQTDGPWIGHRFCITTLDRLPLPPAGKEWRDVTEMIVELLSDYREV